MVDMTLNDQISEKAQQTRQEAVSFDNALAAQFKDLTDKTGHNLEIITKQVDLHKDVAEKENAIANEVGIISAMFSKNALLENLVYAKIQEKLSVFPKKTEEDEVKEPTVTAAPKVPKKKKKKPSFSFPSIPFFSRKSKVASPPKSMASGGVVGGGNGKIQQEVKQNSAIPYADVMQLSLEASGLGAVSVLGEFIKGTGALGGFFLPYYKSMVEPFSLALGVSKDSLYSLLGGSLQTAKLDLKEQQKYFGKMWGKFLNDPDFVDKFIDREATTEGERPKGPASKDFWLLAVAATFENSDPQGAADVAQAIYNRLAFPGWPKTIRDIILAPNQFEPVRRYGGVEEWSKIQDESSAKEFVKKHGISEQTLLKVAESLQDPSKQSSALQFVGARDNFRADATEDSLNHLDDATEVSRHGHTFGVEPGGANYGAYVAGKLNPGPIPSFARGGGLQTIAPLSLILGSKSGYPVSLDGKTTAFTGHGFEIIENGKVYPIDTPAFNLFVDKEKTFTRWAEIYYDKSFDITTALREVTKNPVATNQIQKPKVIVNKIPSDKSTTTVATSTSDSSSSIIEEQFNPHLFNQERYLLSLK